MDMSRSLQGSFLIGANLQGEVNFYAIVVPMLEHTLTGPKEHKINPTSSMTIRKLLSQADATILAHCEDAFQQVFRSMKKPNSDINTRLISGDAWCGNDNGTSSSIAATGGLSSDGTMVPEKDVYGQWSLRVA